MGSVTPICSRGASTIRWPSSNWRCALIRTFAGPGFLRGNAMLLRRWQEGDLAARRALRLSPRDPLSALYHGIVAYAQFIGRNYDEAIRLSQEALRQRGDFVGGPPCADCGCSHGRTARCR